LQLGFCGESVSGIDILNNMLNENYMFVAVVISIIGNLSYIAGTLQGKIKPNRVSFFLWSFIALIAFAAEIKEGVGIQSLTTLMVGLGPLSIFIASFVNKKSYWKITRFDIICGVLSLTGLLLWLITKVGNTAILFALIADALAAVPTIVKVYNYPDTERPFPWLTSVIVGLITLLTITDWSFAYYAFPLSILITNLLVFALINYRSKTFKLI